MAETLIDKFFDNALHKAVPETCTTIGIDQLMIVKQEFAELLIKECARFDSERNYSEHVDGATFNRPILEHFGIIKPGKLSYSEWKKKFGTITVTDDIRRVLKDVHGVDATEEVDFALKKEYWCYLTEEFKKKGI